MYSTVPIPSTRTQYASEKEGQNHSWQLLGLFRAHNVGLNSAVNCNSHFNALQVSHRSGKPSIIRYKSQKTCWCFIYLELWY